MNRREALVTLAALWAAPASGGSKIQVIDTHQHLWDLSRVKPPWVPATGPLAGNHRLQEYRAEASGLEISGTVYMEVDVAPTDHVAEAEFVLELGRVRGSRMRGAVIGGRPGESGFAAYLDRFRGEPFVKGVRQILHVPSTPRGFCLSDSFVEGVRELGRRDLSFDICVPSSGLADAAELCHRCPDTRFILDHCGNGDPNAADLTEWRRGIDAVAARPNVDCKISGIVASAREGWKAADLAPIIDHCAQAFGPDRIIWASDWPVCTARASLRQWLAAAQEVTADWPEADRRKLFHDNAVRVYALKRG